MSDFTKYFPESHSLKNKTLVHRYNLTLKFLKRHLSPPLKVLDLGVPNLFAEIMKKEGFQVDNTPPEMDLDIEYDVVKTDDYDLVTAFEIFEHMVAPFNILRAIQAEHLVASVPLNLWFARAYWNEKDEWDRHYHEFEPRQFDMLLDKSGWEVIDSEKWVSPGKAIGLRPLLRRITPRYYIVYCKRKRQ